MNVIADGSTPPASIESNPHAGPITIDVLTGHRRVSPTLFGLFFEDINFSADGGLNANVVNNYTFDGAYIDKKTASEARTVLTKKPPKRVYDRTRHWAITGGTLEARDENKPTGEEFYGRIHSDGHAVLRNSGYPGTRPAIPARDGHCFLLSARVRSVGFEGELVIRLVDERGGILASSSVSVRDTEWHTLDARLASHATALTYLEIVFIGTGRCDIDEVVLVPEDHWGAGDPRWSQGVLRRDLVEALRDLHPTFMRFPGGCIVEGLGDGSAYDWKRTVGPLARRKSEYNLWALDADGDYSQSHQVGFYEYFLLCEDLGMEPLPVINAGIACQIRSRTTVPTNSRAFDALVQDAVDLIEWATGDPASNEWAALRAEAGHPEPFALNYIGIGNENLGADYLARFDRIRTAIGDRASHIVPVLASGFAPKGKAIDAAWEHARSADTDVLVDEHFYASPKWVTNQTERYDSYPRGKAKVFLGEYAAQLPSIFPFFKYQPHNRFGSALAEAAFLTGVERNADVVAMTSYAPLFTMAENSQWTHNLIEFSPTEVLRTPNYFVQQLFGATVGERILEIEGALPEGVFGSATATDTNISVKLVNTTRSNATIDIHLPGVTAPTATSSVLSARKSAGNTLGFTGKAAYTVEPVDGVVEISSGWLHAEVSAESVTAFSIDLAAPSAPR